MVEKLYYQVKKSVDLSQLPKIEGPDLEKPFNLDNYVKSLSSSGIQAANLGQAITITNAMIRENVPVFLSFTSNMISSGMREVISYLAKHNKVALFCTSGGGVEEDAIKAKMPFRVGNFQANGENLLDAGVARIGNMYATNEHYTHFEFFIREVFQKVLDEKLNENKLITPTSIARMMGKLIGEKEDYDESTSYLYWAYKNDIPVYAPAIIDGAIGDIAYFFRRENPEFIIDILADHTKIVNYTLNCEKTGCIAIGGGVSKHYILNANIFREGFDFAVYISTAVSYNGSDSGGNQEEAISWAKIKPNAPNVKVQSEASLVFPLLVAATFAKESN